MDGTRMGVRTVWCEAEKEEGGGGLEMASRGLQTSVSLTLQPRAVSSATVRFLLLPPLHPYPQTYLPPPALSLHCLPGPLIARTNGFRCHSKSLCKQPGRVARTAV